MRIGVVGGGISGLTAAHLLAARGHDVALIDDGLRPGGLIASERRDGFLCERGPQAVLDGAAETRALIASAGLAGRAVAAAPEARRRFVYVGGALRPFPTSPPALLRTSLLSAAGKLRLLGEPFVRRGHASVGAADGAADESVLDFVARRFGREAADRAGAPAMIGVFAGDAARLSLRAALPRIAEMERAHGSVVRAMFRRRRGDGLGRSISFPDGLAELPTALTGKLGSRVVSGRAAALERAATGWRVQLASGSALDFERLVLATPAAATAALLEPHAPIAAGALRAIPYAPVAVVCLGFHDARDLGIDLGAYGFVVARGEGVRTLGCQFDSTVFPRRAPAGGALLRALVGGVFDPALVDADDATLTAQTVADLGRAAGLRRDPDFVSVWRARPGIPQYDLGHPARVRAVDEALARLPGVSVIGNALRGVGVADCIRAATALAAAFRT